MKLEFRIHKIPARGGEFREPGADNLLMAHTSTGQLWFLWDKNVEHESDCAGHCRFKLRKIG
jgi:hypothetical protein